MVLPVLGGATIKLLCPLPTGAIRSIILGVKSLSSGLNSVSKFIFSFLVFAFFSQKKNAKNRSETAVRKNHRKIGLRGPILGLKIDENRRPKARKSQKLRKQIVF